MGPYQIHKKNNIKMDDLGVPLFVEGQNPIKMDDLGVPLFLEGHPYTNYKSHID